MTLNLAPTTGSLWGRFRVALKLGWRDIGRYKGRSGLIAALIALPVFCGAVTLTVVFSAIPTAAETVTKELGQTQGRLSSMAPFNAHSVQGPQGDLGYSNSIGERDPAFRPTPLKELVPAGYKALSWKRFSVTTPLHGTEFAIDSVAADTLDPAFAGKYTLLGGHGPSTQEEILASPGFLARFSLRPGDKVATSVGNFVISGSLRAASVLDSESLLYFGSRQLPPAATATTSSEAIYLAGNKPLNWDAVSRPNAGGAFLTSRALLLNPPEQSELPAENRQLDNQIVTQLIGNYAPMVIIGLTLLVLETCLLAGAAFAVGARKQQRDLALLSVSGAEAGMLRTTVVTSGLWLGLLGGVSGAVLGALAGSAAVYVLQQQGNPRFQGIHVSLPALLTLLAVAVIAGLVSALVPARSVARAAVRSTLGVSGAPRKHHRLGLIISAGLALLGVALLIGATAVSVATRNDPNSPVNPPAVPALAAAGGVLLIVAVILVLGRILALVTTKASFLPMALRLAARDAARNSGRTVPAISAVLAAAVLAGAFMAFAATSQATSQANYKYLLNPGQAGIPLEYYRWPAGPGANSPGQAGQPTIGKVDPAPLAADLQKAFGTAQISRVLRGSPSSLACVVSSESTAHGGATDKPCFRWELKVPEPNSCLVRRDGLAVDLNDWRCQGSMADGHSNEDIPAILVGGEPELEAILGRKPGAQALETLKSGGMVTTNRAFETSDHQVSLISYDSHAPAPEPETQNFSQMPARIVHRPVTEHVLSSVVETPEKALGTFGVISPETAKAVKMPVADGTLLVTFNRSLSVQEKDIFQAVAFSHLSQTNLPVRVEEGPQDQLTLLLWALVAGAALVTLSASGIASGLALADASRDHATLASIGAPTHLRRSISAAQTWLSSTLGVILGLALGAIPAYVVLMTQRNSEFSVPWPQALITALVIPALGALVAWLLTKSRVPLPRRQ